MFPKEAQTHQLPSPCSSILTSQDQSLIDKSQLNTPHSATSLLTISQNKDILHATVPYNIQDHRSTQDPCKHNDCKTCKDLYDTTYHPNNPLFSSTHAHFESLIDNYNNSSQIITHTQNSLEIINNAEALFSTNNQNMSPRENIQNNNQFSPPNS